MTAGAGPGAAASYVLRTIADRAGSYAPGIQDEIFDELHAADAGCTLDAVARWFAARAAALHALGYRLHCERITTQTRDVLAWIDTGRGLRGALLAVTPASTIGITCERGAMILVEPSGPRPTCKPFPPTLIEAHPDEVRQGLALHWT